MLFHRMNGEESAEQFLPIEGTSVRSQGALRQPARVMLVGNQDAVRQVIRRLDD